MTNQRERILGKIRSAVSIERVSEWQTDLDKRLQQPPVLIRPALPQELLENFADKLQQSGGSIAWVGTRAEVNDALSDYLLARALPLKIRVAPALKDTSWDSTFEVSYGSTRGNDHVSVTPAFCAVAETGSVVLLSSENSPTSLNFLPDVHIVVLFKDQIVSHIEDVWTQLRSCIDMPRSVNFITGPSKTADIEQILQIGAHGPRAFHVIVVGG